MSVPRHPGPPAALRAEALACRAVPLRLSLPAGAALLEVAARAPSAWLRFSGPVARLRYVIPADAPDDRHAAWYSETYAPDGPVTVRAAGLFTGPREGAPFLHCHGGWEGAPGAGHVLPDQARPGAGVLFDGWRIAGAQMQAGHDAETNFTLYRPLATGPEGAEGARALLVRLAPGEDLGPALARLCAGHGLGRVRVEGLGSLNGARMADGRRVAPGATEFLIRSGRAGPRGARLDIMLVDRAGAVTEGVLAGQGNAVFVTAEILLIAESG